MNNDQTEKTIFEKIIAGEIPCHKVYENEFVFAFLDASPHNPGHTLVVPKKPFKDIFEIPKSELSELIQAVQFLGSKIKTAVGANGIKISMNNGKAAGQIVFHAHIHIIPKFEKDNWPKNYQYEDGEALEVQSKILAEIGKNI